MNAFSFIVRFFKVYPENNQNAYLFNLLKENLDKLHFFKINIKLYRFSNLLTEIIKDYILSIFNLNDKENY